MNGVLVVAAHALRESLRRRVFAVVLVLTLAFGGLYTWGASELFKDVTGFGNNEFGLDAPTLAGATLLGLAMFGTLFLGAVLAVFLTLSAVRGDAETGLLQPLIVRPLGRHQYLAGRFLAAATVAFTYVGRGLRGRRGHHRHHRRLVARSRPSAPACASRSGWSWWRRCRCWARSS